MSTCFFAFEEIHLGECVYIFIIHTHYIYKCKLYIFISYKLYITTYSYNHIIIISIMKPHSGMGTYKKNWDSEMSNQTLWTPQLTWAIIQIDSVWWTKVITWYCVVIHFRKTSVEIFFKNQECIHVFFTISWMWKVAGLHWINYAN